MPRQHSKFMHYKIGHCTQCEAQVMVRDTNGMWNSFMPKFKQAEMYYEDEHRVRITICSDCLEKPELSKIHENLIHSESQTGESAKETLRKKVNPVKVLEFKL